MVYMGVHGVQAGHGLYGGAQGPGLSWVIWGCTGSRLVTGYMGVHRVPNGHGFMALHSKPHRYKAPISPSVIGRGAVVFSTLQH